MSCASTARIQCGPLDNCYYGPTKEFQTAIDFIVDANFPKERGEYKAVLWKDRDIINAWVDHKKHINISTKMFIELDSKQLMAVVAHELAHLKLYHYYTNLGTRIISSVGLSIANSVVPGIGYLPLDSVVRAAFSRAQESSADIRGIQYLRKAGLTKEDFLNLLYWMKNKEGQKSYSSFLATHPETNKRIEIIKDLE